MSDPEQGHYLTRPTTIRRLWWAFSAILVATVLLQLVIYVKGYFTVDGWFGFGAIYGHVNFTMLIR